MAFNNTYTLNVDLKQSLTSVVPTFKQGETGILRFRLFDNGQDLNISSYTSSEIVHKLPSGATVLGNLDLVTVDGEQLLEYQYTGVEMAEVGKIITQVVIQSGDTNIAIRPFKVVIYDDLMDDTNLTYVGILQELIAEISLLKEELYKVINSWIFRNTYSPNVQYFKYNVVEYQGSSWIALRDNIGNVPPTLPSISNLDWYLIAKKGDITSITVNGISPNADNDIVLNSNDVGAVSQVDFNTHTKLQASTSQYGHTKLNNTLNSTSVTEAATANTVKLVNDEVNLKFNKTGGRISEVIEIGVRNILQKGISIEGKSPTNGTLINTQVLGGAGAIFSLKISGYAAFREAEVFPVDMTIMVHSAYSPTINDFKIDVKVINNGSFSPAIKAGFLSNSNKITLIHIDTRNLWYTKMYFDGVTIGNGLTITDSSLELSNATYITKATIDRPLTNI